MNDVTRDLDGRHPSKEAVRCDIDSDTLPNRWSIQAVANFDASSEQEDDEKRIRQAKDAERLRGNVIGDKDGLSGTSRASSGNRDLSIAPNDTLVNLASEVKDAGVTGVTRSRSLPHQGSHSVDVETEVEGTIDYTLDEEGLFLGETPHSAHSNDFMTGALHAFDKRKMSLNTNDATVCTGDMRSQVEHQPLRLINARELLTEYPLFYDPEVYSRRIPSEVFITVLGVSLAVVEKSEILKAAESTDEIDHDEVMLGELYRRLGVVPEFYAEKRVIYPEDLEPWLGLGNEHLDHSYWDVLWSPLDEPEHD